MEGGAPALHGRPRRAARREHRRRDGRACGTRREAPEDPDGLCDHLLATLVPAGGATDDVALLTLRNLPVPDHFSAEFPAEPESLAPMRSMLRRWLSHAGAGSWRSRRSSPPAGRRPRTRSSAGMSGDRRFEVSGSRDGREVEIAVRDQGSWRRGARGDHGRGLDLMRTLMDTVAVEPGSGARPLACAAGSRATEVLLTEELVEVQIEERKGADVVVARLTGELDISGAESTGQRIAEAVPSSARGVVVDMSELEFIDSSGISMLFALARRWGAGARSCAWWRPRGSRSPACSTSSSSTRRRRSTRTWTRRSPRSPRPAPRGGAAAARG